MRHKDSYCILRQVRSNSQEALWMPLMQKYDSMTDFELVDELSKIANVKVPQAIEDIRSAAVLHKTVCEVDEMPKVVKEFLEIR